MPDLSAREVALLVPIAAAVLWMGVYPESFLAPMRADIRALEARLAPAAPAGDSHIKMSAAKPAGEAHHEDVSAHGEAH
jgi:NADH-quinone oxidoreductase subunit M